MRIIIIFLLLFSFSCSSQELSKHLQISYQVYVAVSSPITYPAILYVKDSATIYQIQASLRKSWNETQTKPEMAQYISSGTAKDDYIKINHQAKEILFFDQLPSGNVLVKDIYPDLPWAITADTKKIAGYSCVKATTGYRGRNWIAWFAPDIAVPYGPWKLHGLPGIILELSDTNDVFKMTAAKVENKESDIFDKDFAELSTGVRNKKPVTYQQFLADRDEAFDNLVKKVNSEGGNARRTVTPRTGYELKYEWEE